MLLRLTVATMNRWHDLTRPDETDRGDSPVPTVIIWVGIAAVAVGLVVWATGYVNGYINSGTAPTSIPT